jgi:hypothetical protein
VPLQIITIPWVTRSRALQQVERQKEAGEISSQDLLDTLEDMVGMLL